MTTGYYVIKMHRRGGSYLNSAGCPVTHDANGVPLRNKTRWTDEAVERFGDEASVLIALMSDMHEAECSVPMWIEQTPAGYLPPVRATKRLQAWLQQYVRPLPTTVG